MNRSRKIAIIISLILGLFTFKTFSLGAGFQVGLIPALDINQDNIKLDDFETNITGTLRLFRLPGTLGLMLQHQHQETTEPQPEKSLLLLLTLAISISG